MRVQYQKIQPEWLHLGENFIYYYCNGSISSQLQAKIHADLTLTKDFRLVSQENASGRCLMIDPGKEFPEPGGARALQGAAPFT